MGTKYGCLKIFRNTFFKYWVFCDGALLIGVTADLWNGIGFNEVRDLGLECGLEDLIMRVNAGMELAIEGWLVINV